MAARICAPPKEVPAPKYDFENYDSVEHEKKEEKFIQDLRTYCRTKGSSDIAGEEICFPAGDGVARYMVFSLKPLQLIHMPVGDNWHFRQEELLTVKYVRDEVKKNKAGWLPPMFKQ